MFLTPAVSRALATAALLGLCAACATQPEQEAAQHEQKTYRTGSNIAVKDYGMDDNVKSVDPETVRRSMGSTMPGITAGTVTPGGGSR